MCSVFGNGIVPISILNSGHRINIMVGRGEFLPEVRKFGLDLPSIRPACYAPRDAVNIHDRSRIQNEMVAFGIVSA